MDELTNELGISDVTLSTQVPDEAEKERALQQHADVLAPILSNTSTSLSPSSFVDIDLTAFVSDKGQGWAISSVFSAPLATATILNSSTVRITSGAVSGDDDIFVNITNENPRPSTRQLKISVTINETAFANGYTYERTILASRQNVTGGTIDGFTARFDITEPDLRSVSNGGKVQSVDGYDIIF